MMQNKHPEFETDNNKLEEEMLVVLVTDLQEKHTAESSAIQKMIEIQVKWLLLPNVLMISNPNCILI